MCIILEGQVVFNEGNEYVKCMRVHTEIISKADTVIILQAFKDKSKKATLRHLVRKKHPGSQDCA